MRPGKRIISILEDIFVEIFVLTLLYLGFLSNPQRLSLIHALEFEGFYRSSCSSVNRIFNSFLIDVFSFSPPLFSDLFDFCFNLSISFFYFFLTSNGLLKINRIVNKRRVTLD